MFHTAQSTLDHSVSRVAEDLPRTPLLMNLNFREHPRLLKNSLYARFGLGSGTKHAVFGALRARFAVTLSSTPTFSTGWRILGTSPLWDSRNFPFDNSRK
jgi:hypothetical protein